MRLVGQVDIVAGRLAVSPGGEEFPLHVVVVAKRRTAFGEHRIRLDVEGRGYRLFFRHRLRLFACLPRRLDDGFLEGCHQLRRIGGLEIFAAGVFGQARHLLAFLRRQAEADDMGGKIDALLFQLACERARIGLAGFQPVGDEDDGRLLLGIFQRFRRLLHGGAERRLALRVDAVDEGGDLVGIADARRHGKLDVAAGALFAVAVDHQAERIVGGHRLQHLVQRFACDRHFRLAADLAPHRAGGIEHDDRLFGRDGGSEEGGETKKHCHDEKSHRNFLHRSVLRVGLHGACRGASAMPERRRPEDRAFPLTHEPHELFWHLPFRFSFW